MYVEMAFQLNLYRQTTDPDIIGISSVLDVGDEENSERMCNIDHEAASPYTIHTAVLPKTIPH
jgi:hypothetical protein